MSLVDLLGERAQSQPDQIAYIFLLDGETESQSLTYSELDAKARAIASHLQQWQGERALLLYPSGLEFISAFMGCLYAGVVAVPVYPPRRNQKLSRLLNIVNDAQACIALTTTSILADLEQRWASDGELAQLKLVATDTIVANPLGALSVGELNSPRVAPQDLVPLSVTGSSLAFLQYTSGSTGRPKGVMVSHGNIIHNQQIIHQVFGHSKQSIGVSWLPLFHDMGLILNVVQPMYLGFPSILMPPVAFLQKPIRWLKAIYNYRATTSGGPNFAYDLCVKKIPEEQLGNLDLSSWDVAFNGAEPVRAETLNKFGQKFANCGFNYSAFSPCYGMAETTLFATGGQKNHLPVIQAVLAGELEENSVVESDISSPESQKLVAVGRPYLNTTVIIVNPESLTPCEPGKVGEIWVRGGSVTSGYWNRPQATQETFQASLKDTEDGPFLRTGDLGFFSKGELFVTGRLKDLIIIRGRNYYPQDIELTVEKSHPALRSNCGAAFSHQVEGSERLVVVQEVERTYLRKLNIDEVTEAIHQAVSSEHELVIDTIVLLKPGRIPKTSSGKIQRSVCRKQFLDGSLQNIVLTKSVQKVQTQVKGIEFSLLYFSSNSSELTDRKYRLLLEGAKFADQNNFHAVWIPERHFHPFGGLYPEPSVLASAIATITEKIRIRPGSVVLPLQNPVRVAEQWSVVDNLSEGRVDISFARGWNPNDFVLSPSTYANRTEVMFDRIKTVQKLWRGESVCLPNGIGEDTEIKIYPLPCQPELPIWITCTGGKERFVEAGAIGANILTALLFQPIEELAEKIALYRESRSKNGYDPNSGHVTLMLHTFVSEEMEFVRNKVRQPFIEYLQSSVDLWRHDSENLDELTASERDKLLAYAFERYFQITALFGTPSSCLSIVNQLKEIGVDEIACLIDFGIDADSVIGSLDHLNQLRKLANELSDRQTSKEVEWQAMTVNHSLLAVSKKINKDLSETRATQRVSTQVNEDLLLHGLQAKIAQQIAEFFNIVPGKIEFNKSFFSLGINSLKAVEFIENLSENFDISVSPTLLFEYPTIAQLSEYLVEVHEIKISHWMTVAEEESNLLWRDVKQQTYLDSSQGMKPENLEGTEVKESNWIEVEL
ncbi:hypothetical protein BJP34_27460 [Moorena producens PAL-8-15-08-1]|uniref:Carrier domain-containing protein n=1 Tax=Moorena producens PAL-8-15-08-1 TaxID=1458985 RepID=A0A1D8TYF2_9CYAN|nr:hypothetical protein BJP34_27460 [Moorena producens PAL-8-15-08-1]